MTMSSSEKNDTNQIRFSISYSSKIQALSFQVTLKLPFLACLLANPRDNRLMYAAQEKW